MKYLMATAFLFVGLSLQADDITTGAPAPAAPESKKMTTKDAKKSCKELGMTGPELVKCMKEKKNEK